MRIVPNLVQRYQLVREPIRGLRLGQFQAVLLLEADRVVQVRPIRRQLMVVQVEMLRHRVDGRERRIRCALANRRIVAVPYEIRIRRARWGRWVLSQLLPYDN